MNLTGEWKGFYEYGFGYDLSHFGQRVNFQLSLIDDAAALKGSSQEEKSDYSVDLDGTIKGFHEDRLVSFIKTYPKTPDIQADGSIIFKEGSLEVEHIGELDESLTKMFGKWTVFMEFEEDGTLYETQFEGIWYLEKI